MKVKEKELIKKIFSQKFRTENTQNLRAIKRPRSQSMRWRVLFFSSFSRGCVLFSSSSSFFFSVSSSSLRPYGCAALCLRPYAYAAPLLCAYVLRPCVLRLCAFACFVFPFLFFRFVGGETFHEHYAAISRKKKSW